MMSMSVRRMCLKDMLINSNWNFIWMRHGYFDAFHNFHWIRFLHFNWIRLLDGVRYSFLNDLMFDCVDWHWKETNSVIHLSIFVDYILLFTFDRMVYRYMNWIRLWTINECKNTVKFSMATRNTGIISNHSHWHIYIGRFGDRNRRWDVNGHLFVNWHRYGSCLNWLGCWNFTSVQRVAIRKTGICAG